jgi:hypothetical protein
MVARVTFAPHVVDLDWIEVVLAAPQILALPLAVVRASHVDCSWME